MKGGVAIRPISLVGDAIEAGGVGARAAADAKAARVGRGEASLVVPVGSLGISRRAFRRGRCAAAAGGGYVAAIVEVADLVRERDVVGVRGPDHPGLLRRGAVHRMEILGDQLALAAVWLIQRRSKPVARAGGHRTGLAVGLILDTDEQSAARVV